MTELVLATIIEDGRTFEENALKKARALAIFTKDVAVADDSGLAVDALNGSPGVFSARYSGEGATDLKNNLGLLNDLKDTPPNERGAAFKCAIAVVVPDGFEEVVTGECRGSVGFEMRGNEGFGYDPLFIPNGFDKTFAELGMEIKNRTSHRFRAITAVRPVLEKIFYVNKKELSF
ncbi:RdgB/HAM1 family non-canonical purine NTP pyrophosphatase [Candidatus Woesearchaeota archaeon]|nr:RdgB/HAM1 family non-canonical purine NTP pyrophosphatase [Candidatus Woesearchaeota archaeon]